MTIPASLRKRFHLHDGSLVIAEEREDGILIRPAEVMPVEVYSDERIAEFLLTDAVTPEEYDLVRDEVIKMGLDPDRIRHVKPI